MFGTERKRQRPSGRLDAPTSTMKTPTRPRFTIGGTQINSTTKKDQGGQPRFSVGNVPASARRHSVFRSLTSNFKDTRPLFTKDCQNDMIKTVHEFLEEHDGENCLPERLIRSPTKQDFVRIFESIYQHLSPDFQLNNVIEEVPMIFRELGYPVPIKPSTMQTIGASHSWPTLLGALTWLIEQVFYTLQGQVGQQLLLGGDDSSGTLKAYRYSWLCAGFKDYVRNRDAFRNESVFDGKVQALRNWYEQQEDLDCQQKTIEAALLQINAECAELEDDNTINIEVEAATQVLEEHRQKAAELERVLKSQEEIHGMCSTEARSITAELEQTKLTIRDLNTELEQLCKQHWLAVPRSKSAFAKQLNRYHKLIEEVKMLRMSIEAEDCSLPDDHIMDAMSLQQSVKGCKNLLEDTEAKFVQRRWDLELQIKQLKSEAENVKQEEGVISGKLREAQRAELRAERQRSRDREDCDKDIIAAEAEIDTLVMENEEHSRVLREKQARICDAVLTRFHVIVSDLDMMKSHEWMMRTLQEYVDIRKQLDELCNDEDGVPNQYGSDRSIRC
ncbi:unnamed protein product [Nippostrongylus brasiliensis]|uniref:Kinetochore protein NDC80 n=1 Tax=Nippostrongylus brasiliensis TaxID=27835 RepID=A0A158QXX8_NIPBR|nr:unnamed protein product [Nippostrongylus brasiliensis]